MTRLAFAGIVLALSLAGCSQTYRTLREARLAPNGNHAALETSDVQVTYVPLMYESEQYLGYRFWTCKQQSSQLVCEVLCDDGELICSRFRSGMFGKVSRAK